MTRNLFDVTAIAISLDIDAKSSLFVLVSEDETINRRGAGYPEHTEVDLYMGVTDPAVFEAVRDRLTADMLEYKGETL